MASVFISYSSKDKRVARRVAKDLKRLGHRIWLDEWQIKIGQCIPTEIQDGIENSDYIILLLSEHAVESKWVEREWKIAYWEEVNANSIMILPACIEPCEVPKLLKTKKYAALYDSYDQGLFEIATSLEYYSKARQKKDFYHAIDEAWQKDINLSEVEANFRNEHWDHFQAYINSLNGTKKLATQKLNTLFYLEDYRLSVLQLKEQFKTLGLYKGEMNDNLTDDVIYAIEKFQKLYNLRHIDGVFGPLTYLAMEEVIKNLTN